MVAGSIEVISRSPEATQNIGKILGEYARPGHVYLLLGELGAGKTCLTQGVLWGLGAAEYARSPTFVMVGQYQARITLYHIDLYRIDTPDEVHDLGLDEYLYAEGLCVVEWADKALALLPRDHLKIRIERVDGMTRRLEISGSAPAYDEVLDAIRSNVTGT